MSMSNKVYNVLKWVALICLPAITTFWLTISMIWDIPYGEAIGATITAIATLIGSLIGISTSSYNKAKENIDNGKDNN